MLNQIDFFEKLFYPKTFAFIGANPRRFWILSGYISRFPKHSLYIVSNYYDEFMEKHEELFKGVNIYTDISDIPDEINHSFSS